MEGNMIIWLIEANCVLLVTLKAWEDVFREILNVCYMGESPALLVFYWGRGASGAHILIVKGHGIYKNCFTYIIQEATAPLPPKKTAPWIPYEYVV